MHAKQVCHKIINNTLGWMHSSRREAVNACVLGAINGRHLSVTGMGRAINSPAKEKHCIKRADRLLSNVNLYHEHRDIYKDFTTLIIGATQRPVILIDWSDLDEYKQHFLLRAAIALQGRSLTLYEEAHPLEKKEKPKVHKAFLKQLKAMLPPGSQPILVSDAGFRTPWFKAVEKMGWDWVGRIRNRHMIKHPENSRWIDCKAFYQDATTTAKYLGRVQLTRQNPIECELVVFEGKPKGRTKKNKFGARCASKHSEKNAKREREPWLLATSLKETSKLAAQAVKIYKTRMQIEEGFRDNKSVRFGLGFKLNRTKIIKRLQLLLLIASLATLVLWILGSVAKNTGQHWQYQANTVKTRNVLSVIYLGLRIANDERFIMDERDIVTAEKILWEMASEHADK